MVARRLTGRDEHLGAEKLSDLMGGEVLIDMATKGCGVADEGRGRKRGRMGLDIVLRALLFRCGLGRSTDALAGRRSGKACGNLKSMMMVPCLRLS